MLTGCGTVAHTYQPPDASRLKASTGKLSQAVTASHNSARQAQASVVKAQSLASKAKSDVAKLKNVPAPVTQEINDLSAALQEAQDHQKELEQHLNEADLAKAQVEKDKTDYFAQAQKLADAASSENAKAVKAEKSLSWYRWHWWGSWIVLGLGIVACAFLAILKLTGRLML